MKKLLYIICLTLFILGSGFAVPEKLHAQAGQPPAGKCIRVEPVLDTTTVITIAADNPADCAAAGGTWSTSAQGSGILGRIAETINPLNWADNFFAKVSYWILQLVGLLTRLSGLVLNGVIFYTVLRMSENYGNLTAIDTAWTTIRNLANIGFIFILLYAAIKTILGLGGNTKEIVRNVIIVALLINFSLFFTGLVIDAANVLAIFFYDAIAPGALAVSTLSGAITTSGLSNSFVDALNLQSLYQINSDGLNGITTVITIGIMGSIMLLVAAFVFFAAAIMFIIRYVVLVLVLILSPLAFMGWVLPGLKDKVWDKWWDALSGQAFFAPIYFLLVWISLQVVGAIGNSLRAGVPPGDATTALSGAFSAANGADSAGFFGTFINFAVVIVFLIAALIIAKDWANKAGYGINTATKWATGFAGGATFGLAGTTGRQIIGRGAQAITDNEKLKDRASRGGFGGMAARLTLATGRKTAGATFDLRNTGLNKQLDAGKAGGKGGFAEFRKKKAEEAEKRAKAFGPSQEVLDQAEQAVKRATSTQERGMAQARLDQLKGVDDARAKEILKTQGKDNKYIKSEEGKEDIARLKKLTPGEASKRKEAYAKVIEMSKWAKLRGYNQSAAAQIRKGKSKEKKLAEAYKDIAKDDEPGGGETEAPETPPTTEGGTPPATT